MLTTYHKIRCDSRPWCRETYEGIFKSNLRAEAKGLGWSFKATIWGVTHICPKCQAKARGDEGQLKPAGSDVSGRSTSTTVTTDYRTALEKLATAGSRTAQEELGPR